MRSYFLNNEIMDCIVSTESDQNRHSHEYMEMICTLKGKFKIEIDSLYEELAEGEIRFVNANQIHQIKADDTGLYLNIFVNIRLLKELTQQNSVLFKKRILDEDARGSIWEHLRQILNLYLKKDGIDKITLTGFYYMLAGELIKYCLLDEQSQNTPGFKREHRVLEILGYIQTNYQNISGIQELADKMFMSSGYLSKLIKKKTGISFSEYLKQIRMQRALEDLVNTDKAIARIVYDHGFPNPSSFHTQFRKQYQTTPGEFRKKAQVKSLVQENWPDLEKQKEMVIRQYMEQTAAECSMEDQTCNILRADTGITKLLDHQSWNIMINGGDLALLLHAEVQKQILLLHEKLHIKYIRFWNIFQSFMLKGDKNKIYNFSDLDKVIEFLLKHNMKPYIELATKPRRIYRNVNATVLNEPEYELFQDMSVYKSFLEAFMSHFLNKYGECELKSWYFELWRNWELDSLDAYLNIYQTTYECMKSISTKLQLGGAGFSSRYKVEDIRYLFQRWKEYGCEPDFYTVYAYPYESYIQNGRATPKNSADPEFLIHHIQKIKNILSEVQMKSSVIHVTEWNSTVSNRNMLNDSSFKGAFIVKSCLDVLDKADILGYWIATDLFSEYGDTQDRLFGGCGIMTGNGIPKAAFYGFRFLNALYSHILSKSGNCMITSDGMDRFSILIYNYKHYDGKYYLSEEDQVDGEQIFTVFHDYENTRLEYQIKNVKNGRYKMESFYLNSNCGSILEEWSRFNGLKALGEHGLDYLNSICIPRMEMSELEVVNSEISISQSLSANEIRLNLITYVY